MIATKIFLHSLRIEDCSAWVINQGIDVKVNEKTRVRINKLFSRFMDHKQHSTYNYWDIIIRGNYIIAMRFTWEFGSLGGTWEKLEEDLEKYYDGKRDDYKQNKELLEASK